MQRRAAAVYIVFFVVVAIAATSLVTVADEPTASVNGTNYTQGDPLQTGGQSWTVNISNGSGELSRVNGSARFTTSFANNSTLLDRNGSYRPASNGSSGGGAAEANNSSAGSDGANGSAGTRFRVVIANVSGDNASAGNASSGNASGNASTGNASAGNASAGNASANASAGNGSAGNASTVNLTSFTLRETFAVNQRLQADPDVENTTLAGDNETQYVRYRNGTTRPLGEYLPTPETRNVSVGDSFAYANNSTTVAGVNTSGVSLAWTGSQTESKEIKAGENVSVGNTTYVAQFGADNSTVTLSEDVAGYQAELADVQDFHDRVLGLWGIAIISVFAAILIAALAYLPVRS